MSLSVEGIMLQWLKSLLQSARREDLPKGPPAQSMPTVRFDKSLLTAHAREQLKRIVAEVPDIQPQCRTSIHEATITSVLVGGDLASLSRALRDRAGIEPRRAATVALTLVFKASVLTDTERSRRLGITRATWRYARAYCGTAEQDALHAAADGKEFVIEKGLLLGGRWTWPGWDEGCKCFQKPILRKGEHGGRRNDRQKNIS